MRFIQNTIYPDNVDHDVHQNLSDHTSEDGDDGDGNDDGENTKYWFIFANLIFLCYELHRHKDEIIYYPESC